MTTGHLLRVLIIVGLVLLLLGRRRRSAGSQRPLTPPGPGGPQQIGAFRTTPIHTPVQPVHVPEASPAGAESFGSAGPSPFGRMSDPASFSAVEADELSKLDSLRASGTLTEATYLQARGRLFGTTAPEGWSVTLLSPGPNKILAIKLLRECRSDLDLRGAKDLVDSAPQLLFRGLSRADAEQVTNYLQQSGVPAQLGPDA